jgi:regulator of protease activity HflC (stomatin/prohibitin superfamily)
MESEEVKTIGCVSVVGVGVALFIGCFFMWGCPQYRVYSARLEGEAALRKAESERQVQIEDAKGKETAAKMLAGAEIERAKGVAQANKIIGEGLKDNHDYLTYLWIQGLGTNGREVIYVPTEANLPILEAGRFKIHKQEHKEEKK